MAEIQIQDNNVTFQVQLSLDGLMGLEALNVEVAEPARATTLEGGGANDLKHALRLLAWGIPEIVVAGFSSFRTARMLPTLLFVTYTILYLLLTITDVLLLLLLCTVPPSSPSMAKWAKRAAIGLLVLVLLLALAPRAYVAVAVAW